MPFVASIEHGASSVICAPPQWSRCLRLPPQSENLPPNPTGRDAAQKQFRPACCHTAKVKRCRAAPAHIERTLEIVICHLKGFLVQFLIVRRGAKQYHTIFQRLRRDMNRHTIQICPLPLDRRKQFISDMDCRRHPYTALRRGQARLRSRSHDSP